MSDDEILITESKTYRLKDVINFSQYLFDSNLLTVIDYLNFECIGGNISLSDYLENKVNTFNVKFISYPDMPSIANDIMGNLNQDHILVIENYNENNFIDILRDVIANYKDTEFIMIVDKAIYGLLETEIGPSIFNKKGEEEYCKPFEYMYLNEYLQDICFNKCKIAKETNGIPCKECFECFKKYANSVNSWEKLVKFITESIRGDIPLWTHVNSEDRCDFTHYTSGDNKSIDDATKYFIEMNNLRFITVDSQMGELEYHMPFPKYRKEWDKLLNTGIRGDKLICLFEKNMVKKYNTEKIYTDEPSHAERCYVMGFLEKNKALKLSESLKKIGFWAFIPDMTHDKNKVITGNHKLLKGLKEATNPERIAVTWVWKDIHSSISIDTNEDHVILRFPFFSDAIFDSCVLLVLIDPVIGRLGNSNDGLFTHIIKQLKKL